MCKNCKSQSCLRNNQKTFKCIDATTKCNKWETNTECVYCYVKEARDLGCNATLLHEQLQYDRQLLRLKAGSIEKLQIFGLRFFAAGDYRRKDKSILEAVLKDARDLRIPTKAITKNPVELIEDLGQYFDVINISVDNIGNGVDWEIAKALRAKYSNVRIRGVITTLEDLEDKNFMDMLDVITLYHGRKTRTDKDGKIYHFHNFTKAEKEKYSVMYADRICCSSGKCLSCNVKCGLNKAAEVKKAV